MMRPKPRKSRQKNPKPRDLQSEKVEHFHASLSDPKITHENLPTEILTQIFEYLTLKELLQCGNICQRWKIVISNTEKLWKMANLTGKNVPVSFLNHLCSKYVKSRFSDILLAGHSILIHLFSRNKVCIL